MLTKEDSKIIVKWKSTTASSKCSEKMKIIQLINRTTKTISKRLSKMFKIRIKCLTLDKFLNKFQKK
jgi:hypothetical protein